LYEVSEKGGDKRPQEHHNEEPQAGNPGRLLNLWYQSIQNRQELKLLNSLAGLEGLSITHLWDM